MNKAEILAPAGSYESLTAAVRCGADAVYLGSSAFNARRNAENFDDFFIKKAVDYAHSRGVKVYITLNTLIKDSEIPAACSEIENFCIAGADAFIIQDLAIAEMIKKICPDMPLHASTQMSVQSSYGIETLKNLGFSRAVLPRELSEKEIAAISENTDIELECFVHGALCMCLSGQCLMSSVLGGRSGNRGLCAQPCRLPWGIGKPDGNYLSLKDLSLIERIPDLIRAGVRSLKIEGRMKRPEYVAAAVTACKNMLSGKTDINLNDALESVFSRSGFTSGYFDARIGKDMFGIRTKENVEASAKALGSLKKLYDNENPLLGIEMDFSLKKGEKPKLTVKHKDTEVTVSSEEIPCAAQSREVTFEEVKSRLSKCGGTQFYVSDFNADIDSGLFVSAADVNALRRQALDALSDSIAKTEPKSISEFEFSASPHKAGDKKLWVRFFDGREIPDSARRADLIILPLDTDDKTVSAFAKTNEIAAEIPVNVFSNADTYLNRLLELKDLGVNTAFICNTDGIEIARKAGLKPVAGVGTNIMNSLSAAVFIKMGIDHFTVSPEMNISDINALGGDMKYGAVIYGRLPLMVTRNCPIKNKLTCDECKGKSSLTDRKNIAFPVRCKFGASFIFNSVPVGVIDKKADFKTDFDLLYFTTEAGEEADEIIDLYLKNENPDTNLTGGLYFRKLL